MGRPIIGITGELDAARWGDWLREAAILPVSYIRAVERAGGAPLIVPPVPPASVASFVEVVGGRVEERLARSPAREVGEAEHAHIRLDHERKRLDESARDHLVMALTPR